METGADARFHYEAHDRVLSAAEAADEVQGGARLLEAGADPASVPGAVTATALGRGREELLRRVVTLPKSTWIGVCDDRYSCYDAAVLGHWLTDAGHGWLGRVTAPEELADRLDTPTPARIPWALLPVLGAGLFLAGSLTRRRRPTSAVAPLESVGEEAGAKAATLALLKRAGLPVPDGLVLFPGAVTPDSASLGSRLVVRSSAPDEDTATSSAAGRYPTELDVPPSELPAAVERVRRSLPGGAVLVQAMVDARAAGVLFTRGPGAPAFLAVEWAAGPDLVTAGREATTARLSRFDGRLLAGDLPPGVAGAELAGLAHRVEALLGGPQDVEWAWDGTRVLVLQSRPITAGLDGAPPLERERRRVLDTVALDADPASVRWLQDRVGEALPHPTPLALDLLRDIWSRTGAMGRAYELLGLPVPLALDPLDGAPRLQPAFGTLLLTAPEERAPLGAAEQDAARASPGAAEHDADALLARLARHLPARTEALAGRDRSDDLAAMTPAEHAHTLLRWWDELATEDHVGLGMLAIAAEGLADGADAVPTPRSRSRRSLVTLDEGVASGSDEGGAREGSAETTAPRDGPLDPAAPLADLLDRREATRARVQALTDPLRAGLARLDARLGLDGLIGWLRRDELLLAVDAPERYRSLAARRRDLDAAMPRPFLPVTVSPATIEELGAEATGVAGGGRWLTAPAMVSGPARVVDRPEDLRGLETGEILVARHAAVAWAEGLDRAAAVVVQVGGALSHLAILCRERGVPALAGPEGLESVRTGDRLRLGPDGLTPAEEP